MALVTSNTTIQLTDMEMRAALVKAGVIAETDHFGGITRSEDEPGDIVYFISVVSVDTSLKI